MSSTTRYQSSTIFQTLWKLPFLLSFFWTGMCKHVQGCTQPQGRSSRSGVMGKREVLRSVGIRKWFFWKLFLTVPPGLFLKWPHCSFWTIRCKKQLEYKLIYNSKLFIYIEKTDIKLNPQSLILGKHWCRLNERTTTCWCSVLKGGAGS